MLISSATLLTLYYDWSIWKGIAAFFALGIACIIVWLLLVNVKTFSKWLWHTLRRIFKFESKLKYITYTCFKKGLSIQRKRCFTPTKWFSAAPPPWFLVADLFNSDCDLLLQDPAIAPMCITPASRRKNSKPCRWWFFRNAMYLSVAGRFIYEQEKIAITWRYLVRWIWLWCKPPTAIIVSIPFNWFAQTPTEKLHFHARMLRTSLGALFKRLEKRLPVYLMLTNMQDVAGADQWLASYDADTPGMTGQVLNSAYLERVHYQVTKSMEVIFQSLRLQRLNLLSKTRILPDTDFLSFPETIQQLYSPLTNFLSPLCEKDNYLEYGVLSGIFMTGRRCDDQGIARGVFSPYLLDEFIPRHQVKIRQQLVPNLWWLTRRCTQVALSAVIIVAFFKSFYAIKSDEAIIQYQNADSPIEKSYLRFAQTTQLKSHKLYSLFFYPALTWLERDKAWEYQKVTDDQSFSPTDINANLLTRLRNMTSKQQADLIINWAKFINSEQQIANGQALPLLDEMPAYSASVLTGNKITRSFAQQVAVRKSAYILGEGQNLARWRETLRTMIGMKSDLSWLLAAEWPKGSRNITTANYWPVEKDGSRSTALTLPVTSVSTAENQPVLQAESADLPWIYTQPGESFLRQELDQIQSAEGDTEFFQQSRQAFWEDYLSKRQNAWITFASQLPTGVFTVAGEKPWHELLKSVIHRNSPYDRFLADLGNDLSTISDEQAEPWLALYRGLQRQNAVLGQSGLFSTLTRNQMLMRGKLLRRYSRQARRMAKSNQNLLSDTTLGRRKTYLDALQSLAQQVALRPNDAAKLLTSQEAATGKKGAPATLMNVFADFTLWKDASSEQEADGQETLVWNLWQGNAQLVRDYMLLSTANTLQDKWNSKIVWPLNAKIQEASVDVEGIEKDIYQQMLTFIKQDAINALEVTATGVNLKKLAGSSLPLTNNFINYINTYIKPESITGQSAETRKRLLDEKLLLDQQDESKDNRNAVQAGSQQAPAAAAAKPAVLTLAGRPTTANHDALVLPIGTSVRLICTTGDQVLVNLNFNSQAQFQWQPQLCTDVVLTVIFPEFTFRKTYDGEAGILDFINDYSGGEHHYTHIDFPEDDTQLQKNNIKNIIVRYKLSGQDNILSAYNSWQTSQQQAAEHANKREKIDAKLNNLDQPDNLSGILSSLPNNIITPWRLSEENE
ncbi:type VI secretion protein IcmF/TssM N-terminal domain-containing protein [Enterobacteriaceae bacterium LUAb1]